MKALFPMGLALGGLPFHDSWTRQVGQLRSKLFRQHIPVQEKNRLISPGNFLSKKKLSCPICWVYQIGQQFLKVSSPKLTHEKTSWGLFDWITTE